MPENSLICDFQTDSMHPPPNWLCELIGPAGRSRDCRVYKDDRASSRFGDILFVRSDETEVNRLSASTYIVRDEELDQD